MVKDNQISEMGVQAQPLDFRQVSVRACALVRVESRRYCWLTLTHFLPLIQLFSLYLILSTESAR